MKKEFTKKDLKWERPQPVLTDKEKEYLSAVIKPFRNRINYIIKFNSDEEDYIKVNINSDMTIFGVDSIVLPYFKKGTMYKGMIDNKGYTLEELGL